MYLTGRTSKFSVGGIDNFLPGGTSGSNVRDLTALLAHDGPQYATDAELWNAVADALVAVQRKLTRSNSSLNVGLASAVAYGPATSNDPDPHIYITDSVHNQLLVFNVDGSYSSTLKASSSPGASDVGANAYSGVVYVVNQVNNSIDVFAPFLGVMSARMKPAANFKPLGVAHHKGGSYDYLYVINNSTGQRNVEVYDAATFQYKSTITTQGIKVRQGADGLVYLIRNDASIYRIDGLTATKLANVPVRDSYVDITADSSGFVYILDRNAKIIRKFNSVGTELASEAINSAGTSWEFLKVQGLAIDSDGYFYIADNGVVKRTLDQDYVDEFTTDSLVHDAVDGSCLVTGKLTTPLSTPNTTVYPGNTGAARWKKLITNVKPSYYVVMDKATATYTKDVPVEFIVNSPTEIVWPTDIRASIRGYGQNAKVYFKKLPNGTTEGQFVTTLPDGRIKLRYIFTLCQISPAYRQPLDGSYIIDALGYVSSL